MITNLEINQLKKENKKVKHKYNKLVKLLKEKEKYETSKLTKDNSLIEIMINIEAINKKIKKLIDKVD